MDSKISIHIEENETYIRNRLKNCDDCIIRPMLLGEEKKIRCLVVYIEVAVSNMMLEDSVIGKLVNHMWEMPAGEILQFVKDNGMGISDVQPLDTMDAAFASMLAGNAVFFLDGYAKAIKVSSKGYPNLSVAEASREKVLRGYKGGLYRCGKDQFCPGAEADSGYQIKGEAENSWGEKPDRGAAFIYGRFNTPGTFAGHRG